jgi:hypothetical protein
MGIGVRHPPLPLVYHAPRRTPPGPLPVRVVHSHSSLSPWFVRAVRCSCRYRAVPGQAAPYMAVGVRHPQLPLVYQTTPRTPLAPLTGRVGHSRYSRGPCVMRGARWIFRFRASSGQAAPYMAVGVRHPLLPLVYPAPAPHRRPGGAVREPPRSRTAVFHRSLFHLGRRLEGVPKLKFWNTLT